MKAIVLKQYGTPREAFELRELPTPQPGNGQVRIAVDAFGLNYADVSARQGTYNDAPPLPCVIGYEVVGNWYSGARVGERSGGIAAEPG